MIPSFEFLKNRPSVCVRLKWRSLLKRRELSREDRPLPSGSGLPEPRPQKQRATIEADERGLASIEYAIVLIGVSIGVAASLVVIGATVVDSFEWQVGILGLPVP